VLKSGHLNTDLKYADYFFCKWSFHSRLNIFA